MHAPYIHLLMDTQTQLQPTISTNDTYSNMDPPTFTLTCPTSPEKRRLDSPVGDQAEAQTQASCDSTLAHAMSTSSEEYTSNKSSTWGTTQNAVTAECHRTRRVDTPDTAHQKRIMLSNEQQALLQQWYEGFARPDVTPFLPDEHMVAFSTAIKITPEVVMEYVRRRRKGDSTTDHNLDVQQRGEEEMLCSMAVIRPSLEYYTLAKANKHLSPTILRIVERYVSGCSRRRSQNDGRRSVNTGPYRCTFGCGYRTKRAFDWRRHEETHEPQELWLCNICGRNDTNNPFLVNRKDKFLKHVTDKHADLVAETVLDKSKLDFVPRATLGCRYCGEESGNWDERCRHVLGHFEDEVERSMKRVKMVHEEPEDDEGIVSGEDSNVATSVKSGCKGTDNLN